MAVIAKIQCSAKTTSGDGEQRQATVVFGADYADGRNKEWSLYTPCLSLSMTLKGAVADRFEPGARYTLRFMPDDQDTDEQAARRAYSAYAAVTGGKNFLGEPMPAFDDLPNTIRAAWAAAASA